MTPPPPPPKQPLPTPLLVEMLGHICAPYGGGIGHAAPPTVASVRRIEEELQVSLPPLFVEVATACPTYGGWFAGIGEDYHSPAHIVALNRLFHGQGLPARYVMFNHGHDGDCDCWDVEQPATGSAGECRIVYCRTDADAVRWPRPPQPLAGTFHDYLDAFCRSHISSITEKSVRRRMKRLLAEHDDAAGANESGRLD
jgi:hypothetical protein